MRKRSTRVATTSTTAYPYYSCHGEACRTPEDWVAMAHVLHFRPSLAHELRHPITKIAAMRHCVIDLLSEMSWRQLLLPRLGLLPLAAASGTSFFLTSRCSGAGSAAAPSYNDGHQRRAPRMIIGDPDNFARKMNKFSQDGPEQLLVIADFDRTLTPCYKQRSDPSEPLEQESSSHGLLMTSSVLSPEVANAHQELFARYYPVEISSTLSAQEKFPFMAQWWESTHALLVQYKLTKAQVKEAVASGTLGFRPGFHSLFRLLHDQQVPTLVFSAGLYDVIHAALEKEFAAEQKRAGGIAATEIKDEQVFTPDNVHVVSNMMRFDARGRIEGFDGRVIHPLTKTAHALLDSPFWEECQLEKRRNVLLLGDSRGDVHMADGLNADEVIRIGFLNLHVDETLDEYLELYDVVFTNDASLFPVEMLIEQMTATKDKKA